MIVEDMHIVIGLTPSRYQAERRKSLECTPYELKIDLKDTLRAKHSALSANGVKTSNWLKKRSIIDLHLYNILLQIQQYLQESNM